MVFHMVSLMVYHMVSHMVSHMVQFSWADRKVSKTFLKCLVFSRIFVVNSTVVNTVTVINSKLLPIIFDLNYEIP